MSAPFDQAARVAQALADAVFAAGAVDGETLASAFADHVASHFDEREFAERFDRVHKLFHQWMEI